MPENIPYCRHEIGEEEIRAVTAVLRGGWIARGPRVRTLEEACEARLGSSHAIACSSGTGALEIAMRGLGLGPGDDVIVPDVTWVASAMAVLQVGARPVFADVDPETHLLTVETAEAAWTPRTRAVLTVDFAGVPSDVFGLRELAESRGARLIEDAAHAFGAYHCDGTPVGRDEAAHVTTFSFHPAKTITTAEGGLVTTADDVLAERMRRIRSGGITRSFAGSRGSHDYLATEIGGNFHLSELQAALGLVQIDRVDAFLTRRRDAWDRLLDALESLSGELLFPNHLGGSSHNLFIVELAEDGGSADRRDAVLAHLGSEGIGASLHYPLLHRQPVFARSPRAQVPNAERFEARALTLPLFPSITDDEIRRVAHALSEALVRFPAGLRTSPSQREIV